MPDLTVSSSVDTFMQGANQAALRTALALGTASVQDVGYFADADQGSLADSAVQPGDLATVATTGVYSDLSGLPTLGDLAAKSEIVNADIGASAAIALSKLAVDPLARANHTGAQAADTITGLAAVATTGAYADVSGTPTLGDLAAKSEIVNADISAIAEIALSKLATDPLARGNHTGTQTASTISDFASVSAAAAPVQSVAGRTGVVTLAAADVSGLATVATTGAYADLSGLPTLGSLAAKSEIVNADIGALAAIALSKLATDPLARANHTGTQAAATVTGLSTVATTGAYSDLSGLPTLGALADNDTIVIAEISATGTASGTTFLRGDGAWATPSGSGDMVAANNLSDLENAATARTNLGLGTAATEDIGDFVQPANITSGTITAGTGDIDFNNLGGGLANASDVTGGVQVDTDLVVPFGGKIAVYSTADQATNFGRHVLQHDGSNFTIGFEKGGTTSNTISRIKLGTTLSYVQVSSPYNTVEIKGASVVFYDTSNVARLVFAGTSLRGNQSGYMDLGSVGSEFKNLYLTGEALIGGPVKIGTYTFATVPTASSYTGYKITISDRSYRSAYSDGTNWRFEADDAIIS